MTAPASFTSYSPEGKPHITYHAELTADQVRAALNYDPLSGVFRWRIAPRTHPRLAGQVAGAIATGYVMIKLGGRRYKAHRLAWLHTFGHWPSRIVDHIDGNPLNNALANLREATPTENQQNSAPRRGKILPKGVRKNGVGYTARIKVGGRLITLGTYPTIEQAAERYADAAREHFGQFARIA